MSFKINLKDAISRSLKKYNDTYMKEAHNRIDNIVAQAGTDNTEVVDARIDSAGNKHTTLNNRINNEFKLSKEHFQEVSGKYISVENTVPSIIKNIEIHGDTVQNLVNLADIKSTGIDNGDGTFTYTVVSCGQNLCQSIETGYINNSTGEFVPSSVTNRMSNLARVNPHSRYTFTKDNTLRNANKFYYDKNKKFLRMDTDTKPTFDIPSDAYYVGLSFGNSIEVGNFMLSEVDGVTPFEKYEETRCNIKLPCQLEKWDRLYFDKEENAWCVEKFTLRYAPRKQHYTIASLENVYRCFPSSPTLESAEYKNDYGKATTICKGLPFILDNYFARDEEHYYIDPNAKREYLFFNKDKFDGTSEGLNRYFESIDFYMLIKLASPEKIVLPQSEQIKLNSFANKTHIYTISGDVDATVKATVSKSLASTVQANTNEINILSDKIADIQGLKESQDFAYETDKGYLVCKDTQNGIVKDLKIYGKSLVNAWKISDWMKVNTQIVATDKTGTSVMQIMQKDNIFNAGDIVTVVADISVDNPTYCYWQVNYVSTTGEEKSLKNITFQSGVKSFVISLPSDYSYMRCIFVGVQAGNTRTFKNNGCMCIKGDLSGYIPSYFDGIGSVGNGDEIEVSSIKIDGNLFDSSTITKGKALNTNGTDTTIVNENAYISDFIRCFKGVKYNTNRNQYGTVWNLYDKDRRFVKQYTSTKVLTADIDGFLKVHCVYTDKTPEEFMINIGDKDIGYEPFKQDKKTILFKDVDNTWKPLMELNEWDVLDTVSNKLEIGTEKVSFSTSIDWRDNQNPNIEYKTYWKKFEGYKLNNVICDKMPTFNATTFDKKCLFVINNEYLYITLPKSECPDVSNLGEWFVANPMNILIPSPRKEYEINPIYPDSYEGDTMVLVEGGPVGPKASFKITSSLPNFVKELQNQVVQLQDQVYNGNMVSLTVALNTLDNKLRLESLEASN